MSSDYFIKVLATFVNLPLFIIVLKLSASVLRYEADNDA